MFILQPKGTLILDLGKELMVTNLFGVERNWSPYYNKTGDSPTR